MEPGDICRFSINSFRSFYENILRLKIREVTYDWFIGYWESEKHEMTLCISASSEERGKWGADGKGVVIDFVVSDVDEAYTRLVNLGVRFLEPPMDKPRGLSTATILDLPDIRLPVHHIVESLSGIRVPTLDLYGRYDEAAPVIAETSHHSIGGSEFVIFENSAHVPGIMETDRNHS